MGETLNKAADRKGKQYYIALLTILKPPPKILLIRADKPTPVKNTVHMFVLVDLWDNPQVLKTARLKKETSLTPRAGVVVYPHDVMTLISGRDLSGEVLIIV